MPWKVKSESDTEKVWAHYSHGEESGRYRYEFTDGRTVEVGAAGLHVDSPKARVPGWWRRPALIVIPSVALAADLIYHAVR